jgi:hypothetical protein
LPATLSVLLLSHAWRARASTRPSPRLADWFGTWLQQWRCRRIITTTTTTTTASPLSSSGTCRRRCTSSNRFFRVDRRSADRIRMCDLSAWFASGGAPEGSRLAAAMELHQAQKEATTAQQHAPPDFSHGGNQTKQSVLLGSSADFVFLGGTLVLCFRMVMRRSRTRGLICWVGVRT